MQERKERITGNPFIRESTSNVSSITVAISESRLPNWDLGINNNNKKEVGDN